MREDPYNVFENAEFKEAFRLVAQFFDGDVKKTSLWFSSKNLGLGGESPLRMLKAGRGPKLLLWINAQLSLSTPEYQA